MRVISLLSIILSLSVVSAQEVKKNNPPQEQSKIPPALAEASAALERMRSNAPTTLTEAHTALERMLSPEELAKIDAMPSEDGMITYHMSLGLTIRNGWGLWAGSPLAKHMEELGFVVPDDMSGVILETFWCKRHGQDFRLKERAAEYKKYWDAALKTREEQEIRLQKSKAVMRTMMMGLRFEKRDVPVVRMPDRTSRSLRARFLSPFRGGVFLAVCRRTRTENDAFSTPGYFYDPTDGKIHKIRVAEVNDVHSAVVAGPRAWFVGNTNGKAVLVGVNGRDHMTLPLPQEGEPPQLGLDGQSLLVVYPKTIFRLTDQKWTLVYSGDIRLPRSGPPPQLHGNMILFRDEGMHENRKRLWWLTLGEQPCLTSLDGDMGFVDPSQFNWFNSFSCCVTSSGDLWASIGEGYNPKSLFRRSKDGSYSIAIMNNSVQFTEEPFGSKKTDQGLSVSGVTALPDDTLLLVADTGLYRLKGNELVQELAFGSIRRQTASDSGTLVSPGHWDPSNVIVLDDKSYLISSAFGGVYLLRKGHDGQWSFLSLDEERGDPVVW